MWNLTVNGDARSTDYGGYASIFDNIVSFLLYHDRSPSNYIDLIRDNREMFISPPSAHLKRDLVEPRELLFLLYQIELSHRLHWAPRPLRGPGSIMKDYLFYAYDALFCVFCGSMCRPVHAASQKEGTLVQASEYLYERLDPFVYVPPDAADAEQRSSKGRVTEPKYFHFHNCPLVWVEKNCRWNLDRLKWPLAEPSKFYFVIQMIQYTSARCINTEVEWSEWVHRIKDSTIMGACELTLVRLFRKVVEMKLASVDVHKLDIFQQPLHTFHYEGTKGRDARVRAEDSCHFLDNIFCGPERKVTLSRGESKFIYALNVDCAWKTFLMHGFCVQNRIHSRMYYCGVNGFSCNANGYTINSTLEMPAIEMMCVYCGMVFNGKLCEPESIQQLYTKHERQLILEYLSNSATGLPSQRLKVMYKWDFWERSPSAENTMAFHLEEVFSSMELRDRIQQKPNRNEERLSGQEKIILWFSASLNLAHSPLCIFRYKKRVYASEKCPVCMDDLKTTRSPFNCGHTMCGKCVNDIRVTACPVCKIGTRKHRLAGLEFNECLV